MDDFIPAALISPLRQRLIDDMTMREFSRATQNNYIRDVGRLATFLARRPDTTMAEDVRRFQVEQREAGVPLPTMNAIVSALRFFFTHTVDRPDLARKLAEVTYPRKLPVVLSPGEVARLLGATSCLKHQAASSVTSGAGLRVAEVAHLKVSDIDSERMLIRVERGRGGQDRNAMLAADLLTLLREWWKAGRQQDVIYAKGWLFRACTPASRSARGSFIASSSRRHEQPRSPNGVLYQGSDPHRRTVTSPLDKLGLFMPDQGTLGG